MLELFNQARQWRLQYRSKGDQVLAAYCACRERAILDCMLHAGLIDKDTATKMEKLK